MAEQILISRATVEQALEALQHLAGMNCDHSRGICVCEYRDAANNLSAALAQQQAEPVHPSGFAYRYPDGVRFNNGGEVNGCLPSEVIPYYLGKAPHQQQAEPVERKPLTEEEIINIGKEARAIEDSHFLPVTFARAIEAAHGIKEEK